MNIGHVPPNQPGQPGQPGPARPAGVQPGRGTFFAFVAVLVIGGVWWLIGIGQPIALALDTSYEMPLYHHLSSLVGWASPATAFLVFALVTFPYRAGHLVALAIAVLNLFGWLLSTVMTLFDFVDFGLFLRLFEPLLILAAAGLALPGWAWARSHGKSPLKLIAVCIAGAVVLLSGPLNAITSMLQSDSGDGLFGIVTRVGTPLLYGLATAAIVVLASLNAAWSRYVAAGVTAAVFLAELVRSIASFSHEYSSVLAPFLLVNAFGMAAGAAVLAIAALRTGKDRNASPPVASQPPTQQPPQVANPYGSWNPPHR
ncbi:hypothetical protein [uncultured Agrococcus sp.]|uniref:hypothetical protein n=1 Tax=uncultured Agrococcus sp. TaxID=382258 RepID=UPI0025D80EB9|nr:hypothetical protein [uncultured Agrococcus sp.]